MIRNSVTKTTTACFEPSLDYCVVKFPRWDLSKFHRVTAGLGSSMKSVGEVMSIGRSFQEAMQKAIRMATPGLLGFQPPPKGSPGHFTKEQISEELRNPTDMRMYALSQAFAHGESVDSIFEKTKINPWFLYKLQEVHQTRELLTSRAGETVTVDMMRLAKQQGFCDAQIAECVGSTEMEVRACRKALGVLPVVKQVDTLAAEFPAQTNYLYMTYHGDKNDPVVLPPEIANSKGTVVLGCGAYRIGSSVEFDWCAVNCVRTLRKLGKKAIVINYNPETVSTDYDECDLLYFEELSHANPNPDPDPDPNADPDPNLTLTQSLTLTRRSRSSACSTSTSRSRPRASSSPWAGRCPTTWRCRSRRRASTSWARRRRTSTWRRTGTSSPPSSTRSALTSLSGAR